jgi:AraC-like DNA-binding protein
VVEIAYSDGNIEVIGPMTVARPGRYAIGSRVQLLSLDPVSAASWLGIPLALLTDQVVALDDLDKAIAEPLAEGFATGRIADLLHSPQPGHPRRDARADHAVSLLARGHAVSRTAAAVNLGERQFARWFTERTGMQPKRFQRIVRVRRALLAAKQGQSLADIAAHCGFSDQAHLNREVKAFTGEAPRAILPNVGNVQDVAVPLG